MRKPWKDAAKRMEKLHQRINAVPMAVPPRKTRKPIDKEYPKGYYPQPQSPMMDELQEKEGNFPVPKDGAKFQRWTIFSVKRGEIVAWLFPTEEAAKKSPLLKDDLLGKNYKIIPIKMEVGTWFNEPTKKKGHLRRRSGKTLGKKNKSTIQARSG